jgi:hypothetical protein
MKLIGVPALTMIAIVWLGVRAEAQTPCPEEVRLRNAATEAWKEAMKAPPSERCGALYHASLAAEATQITMRVMRHFRPIAEPSGRVLPQGGTGSRQCLCWTSSSTISSR